MKKMTLYHGSPRVVQKPTYGTGKPWHDFGAGFYCTEDQELAKEWACTKGMDGYVNQYELNLEGLSVLDLRAEPYTLLNWVALLVANRKLPVTTPVMKKAFERLQARFLPAVEKYDVIIGYRGDDGYFSTVRKYIHDELSLEELGEQIKKQKIGTQIALKSQKAFSQIQYRSVVSADSGEYGVRRMRRFRGDYTEEARRILGEAMDYAVNSCRLTLDEFMELFLTGGLAEQFEAGMPKYLPGMTGAELACEVLERAGLRMEFPAPKITFTYTREYWCGWILAYYQRITGISYKRIHQHVSMKEVEKLHNSLRMSSDEKFVMIMNRHLEGCKDVTRLQVLRKTAGYSQKALAEKSGVNLRNIQQYEQRAKDINKGAAGSLAAIAKVLGCRVEDLLEQVPPQTFSAK